MIVTLEGLSNKGKQRIKQHGKTWLVIHRTNKVLFSSIEGGWLFVKAIDDSEGLSSRWVNETNDQHFSVTRKD